jgi:glycosyltransferase involved in cell wall biosynthesis
VSSNRTRVKVLVVLGSPFLYGLERAVIDRFDLARPEIEPRFLLAHASKRKNLSILAEVVKRDMAYTFFSDYWDWPKLGKPRSLGHGFHVFVALVLGNLDVLKASRGVEALYVPNRFGLFQALLASVLLRLRGGRTVYEFHDHPDRPLLSLRLLHPLLTDFVSGSKRCYAGVREFHPYIPMHKLHFIQQTVQEVSGAAAAQPFPLDPSRRNVVFIGQMREAKGPDLLLEAFSLVAGEYPDSHLHFVGDSAAGYEKLLRTGIQELKLDSRVTLWGYRADARAILNSAYVFVQPTRPSLCTESFGRGIVEAMSVGVPGLVFPSGGLAETVVHGETGLVCLDETAACLAEGLRTLLADPALRDRYGKAARRRYEAHLAPTVICRQWVKLFRPPVRDVPGDR